MYNINHPLIGIAKDVTPPHKLSNDVYLYSCHSGSGYIGRTFQLFHMIRDYVTKKSYRKLFLSLKVNNHEDLLNNPNVQKIIIIADF